MESIVFTMNVNTSKEIIGDPENLHNLTNKQTSKAEAKK